MLSFDAMVMRMTAIINSDEPGEVRVEAPPGYVWSEGVHELVCVDKRDAVLRMSGGFVECTDPECDWCSDSFNERE